jgi:phosphoenolpyruvate-protein kinase (PTS system EI component)
LAGHQRSGDPKVEAKRVDDALARSLSELATLRAQMRPQVPDSELTIFDGKRMILEDEEFIGRIRENIANGYLAERALLLVIDELCASMSAVHDDYLRERVADFRDLGGFVLRHLRKEEKRGPIQ